MTDLAAEAARRQRNVAAGRAPTDDGPRLVEPDHQPVELQAVTTRRAEGPWTEGREQEEIVRLFLHYGCVVDRTSQARPSNVATGLPDLIVSHEASGQAWWWESKYGPRAKWPAAQRDWCARYERCGWRYGLGDLDAARVWLRQLGIAP